MADDGYFRETFQALTGNDPFPWQEALFQRFVAGDPPKLCDIPTGLGKTAVIQVWLIAFAQSVSGPHPSHRVPRRLVYVVNRRTVVDQSTDEAIRMRDRFGLFVLAPKYRDRLDELKAVLIRATGLKPDDPKAPPFAISTLRGQFADNAEWRTDPSRPAIVIGTVDMIGSRLLFSGYGIGFKSKPLHAGFLGQDALLVHDEAHLEPAFQTLLVAIKNEQTRCNEFQGFHVLELSATTRSGDIVMEPSSASRGDELFGLAKEDLAVPEIRKRIEAKKAIHLHENDDEKKLPDLLAKWAIRHKDANRAVLVFARTVEAVESVAEKLRKALGNSKERVETLTGTIRGKE